MRRSGDRVMYEDDKPWPILCPSCGQAFQKQIGWLKTHDAVRCPGPGCGVLFKYSRKELGLKIAEAGKGLYDPLRNIHRAKTVSEFPEGSE